MTKPNANGRDGKRSKKGNPAASPRDCKFELWAWLPAEVLQAVLTANLSRDAFRCLFALLLEHIGQGGASNGELIHTYADFEASGVPRSCVKAALEQLESAGFIVARRQGRTDNGRRKPTKYGLTWLGMWDSDGLATSPPSNQWKKLLAPSPGTPP